MQDCCSGQTPFQSPTRTKIGSLPGLTLAPTMASGTQMASEEERIQLAITDGTIIPSPAIG
jgi:hypothetical protein